VTIAVSCPHYIENSTLYIIHVLYRLAAGRWFSPHKKKWSSRYNWNIVESGVKHHNDNPNVS